MLNENDKGISKFNKAIVALPIPQPGQGILVNNLKKHID
jgi:hypothetical protein